MKRLIFSILIFVITLIPVTVTAKDKAEKKWDKRERVKYEGWERIKPKTFNYQFAGGMGVSALGIGWQYGKRDQASTDLMIGFLPKKFSERFRLTFTLKETYTTWSIRFCDAVSFEPFYCGLYITTITGGDFWGREPDRYPNKYYNFATRLRVTAFIGESITFYTKWKQFPNITAFYELSTTDLGLVSSVTNSCLRPRDYMRLSFGLKVAFRKYN